MVTRRLSTIIIIQTKPPKYLQIVAMCSQTLDPVAHLHLHTTTFFSVHGGFRWHSDNIGPKTRLDCTRPDIALGPFAPRHCCQSRDSRPRTQQERLDPCCPATSSFGSSLPYPQSQPEASCQLSFHLVVSSLLHCSNFKVGFLSSPCTQARNSISRRLHRHATRKLLTMRS